MNDLQAIVGAAIADSVSFIDDDIGPDRAKALDYYFGRPFGDEQDGRSQVVSRDVHDMVSAALPSLMRVFFGPEHIVEFEPRGPDDVEEAEQKTDYINYIVTTDNDGFEVFYAALKDALRGKVGFVKYWWDDSDETTTRTYTGLDESSLTLLLEDLNEATKAEMVEATEDKNGISCKIKLTKKVDRVRIEALPPEEFLIARDARCIETASFVAHRSLKTASDLRSMGYSEEDVETGATEDLDWDQERLARNPSLTEGGTRIDHSMRRIMHVESFIRSDQDGDGIAELIRVCTLGSTYRLVHSETVDDVQIADFHCDPEPHTYFGESIADKTMDVQLIKSRLLRMGMDGLSQSVFPRTVVGPGGNVEDAMNTEVGAILRAKIGPADYTFQAVPDTSRAVLPMISYMDELRENRTGMSKVSMGLDAEALQNTTATAAEGNFTRSQERIELIARVMASGMRKLFRGIAKLVSENQRAERMVRLRNKWTPVDPRSWAPDMNVICNVGLGGGSSQQKLQMLSMISQKQEQIMMTVGPNNSLVTPKHYYTTLSKMVQESGFKNPDAFFSDPEGEEAQQRQKEQGPPPPDPAMVEAEARMKLEQMKVESQADANQEKAVAELTLARERHQLEVEQRREQQAQEFAFKRELAEADLMFKRELAASEAQMKREIASTELQLKQQEMAMEAELKREAMQADAAMKSQTIDGPSQGGKPG